MPPKEFLYVFIKTAVTLAVVRPPFCYVPGGLQRGVEDTFEILKATGSLGWREARQSPFEPTKARLAGFCWILNKGAPVREGAVWPCPAGDTFRKQAPTTSWANTCGGPTSRQMPGVGGGGVAESPVYFLDNPACLQWTLVDFKSGRAMHMRAPARDAVTQSQPGPVCWQGLGPAFLCRSGHGLTSCQVLTDSTLIKVTGFSWVTHRGPGRCPKGPIVAGLPAAL